jgi:predicted MPP superfamily phosphohydrolase
LLLLPLAAAGIALLAWMRSETGRHGVSRHRLQLAKSCAAPVRILHVSDMHFARSGPAALERLFDRLAGESYDFVFVTGDIIDCGEGIDHAVRNLSKLKARYGRFAVLGNHDYYDYRLLDCFTHNFPWQKYPKNRQPTERLEDMLGRAGIRVLKNETVEVDAGGTSVLVHGLDDATTGKANVRKAMANFNPSKINLLLTHTIDVFLDIGEQEIDVSFSGHSHGGQIRLPGWGAVITHTTMGRAFAGGLIRHKGAVCVVSRGIGTSRFLPFRLLCPPEALVVELETAAG